MIKKIGGECGDSTEQLPTPAITEPPLVIVQSITNPSPTLESEIISEKPAVTDDSSEPVTLQELARNVCYAANWSAIWQLIQRAANFNGKSNKIVLRHLIKHGLSNFDRVRFLAILDLHIKFNPLDEQASKAQAVALSVATEVKI